MQVLVFAGDQLVYSGEFAESVEIGRQDQSSDDPAPCALRRVDDRVRLVVVPASALDVSKRQLRIEPLTAELVRATNLSRVRPVLLSDGRSLAVGESREFVLPLRFVMADVLVHFEAAPVAAASASSYRSLARQTIAPGGTSPADSSAVPVLPRLTSEDAEKLADWLQVLSSVLQSAASSTQFYERAARAVVELVGLDSGAVLVFEHSRPTLRARWSRAQRAASSPSWSPSARILDHVREQKRTFWNNPHTTLAADASLAHVEMVVAAPILNSAGEVIGALYGDRREGNRLGPPPQIDASEAMLVQALASGVAAGLARVEQEQVALAAQVRFEQFFSRELSRQLTADPELLRGRDADVTILFCDIRGFSGISNRIGPSQTFAWINSVMSALSECVARHDGVLVDFIGDELLAMWGAPRECSQHARHACLAALDMLSAMPHVDAQWCSILGEPTQVGIGINSGQARVGNTGSHHRFKYGPLGNTVNLSSRVQGATKFLHTDLLITNATAERLDASFARRRLCQVRAVNIAEPVTLFELRADGNPGWRELCEQYERALSCFEQREFHAAVSRLGSLLGVQPQDGPARALLARTVQALFLEDEAFDPVWQLPGK